MQMRASIARALVTSPDLLLMDNPLAHWMNSRAATRRRVAGTGSARGLTVVFVTHSIVEAVFLSTRVVVMAARPGRVVASVPIDEPYPRTDAFRLRPAFSAQCQHLSQLVADAAAGVTS
jgi:NitT/TauT family transport system ATP-binding protein